MTYHYSKEHQSTQLKIKMDQTASNITIGSTFPTTESNEIKPKELKQTEGAKKRFETRRRLEETKSLLIGLLIYFCNSSVEVVVNARGKIRQDNHVNFYIKSWTYCDENCFIVKMDETDVELIAELEKINQKYKDESTTNFFCNKIRKYLENCGFEFTNISGKNKAITKIPLKNIVDYKFNNNNFPKIDVNIIVNSMMEILKELPCGNSIQTIDIYKVQELINRKYFEQYPEVNAYQHISNETNQSNQSDQFDTMQPNNQNQQIPQQQIQIVYIQLVNIPQLSLSQDVTPNYYYNTSMNMNLGYLLNNNTGLEKLNK